MTWDRRSFVGHLTQLQSVEAIKVGMALLEALRSSGDGPVARDQLRQWSNLLHGQSLRRGTDALEAARIIRVTPGRQGGEATRYELAGRRLFPRE